MSKSPLSQLASLSEELIGKAAQNPAAARLLEAGQQLKDRVDDLSKRVRGLEAMETRIVELEQRIDKLEAKRGGGRKAAVEPASQADTAEDSPPSSAP
jgi:hypothetical protein